MGALPKRKIPRKGRRRANDFLKPINLVNCKECGSTRRSHFACPECGKYNGKQVIKIK